MISGDELLVSTGMIRLISLAILVRSHQPKHLDHCLIMPISLIAHLSCLISVVAKKIGELIINNNNNII